MNDVVKLIGRVTYDPTSDEFTVVPSGSIESSTGEFWGEGGVTAKSDDLLYSFNNLLWSFNSRLVQNDCFADNVVKIVKCNGEYIGLSRSKLYVSTDKEVWTSHKVPSVLDRYPIINSRVIVNDLQSEALSTSVVRIPYGWHVPYFRLPAGFKRASSGGVGNIYAGGLWDPKSLGVEDDFVQLAPTEINDIYLLDFNAWWETMGNAPSLEWVNYRLELVCCDNGVLKYRWLNYEVGFDALAEVPEFITLYMGTTEDFTLASRMFFRYEDNNEIFDRVYVATKQGSLYELQWKHNNFVVRRMSQTSNNEPVVLYQYQHELHVFGRGGLHTVVNMQNRQTEPFSADLDTNLDIVQFSPGVITDALDYGVVVSADGKVYSLAYADWSTELLCDTNDTITSVTITGSPSIVHLTGLSAQYEYNTNFSSLTAYDWQFYFYRSVDPEIEEQRSVSLKNGYGCTYVRPVSLEYINGEYIMLISDGSLYTGQTITSLAYAAKITIPRSEGEYFGELNHSYANTLSVRWMCKIGNVYLMELDNGVIYSSTDKLVWDYSPVTDPMLGALYYSGGELYNVQTTVHEADRLLFVSQTLNQGMSVYKAYGVGLDTPTLLLPGVQDMVEGSTVEASVTWDAVTVIAGDVVVRYTCDKVIDGSVILNVTGNAPRVLTRTDGVIGAEVTFEVRCPVAAGACTVGLSFSRTASSSYSMNFKLVELRLPTVVPMCVAGDFTQLNRTIDSPLPEDCSVVLLGYLLKFEARGLDVNITDQGAAVVVGDSLLWLNSQDGITCDGVSVYDLNLGAFVAVENSNVTTYFEGRKLSLCLDRAYVNHLPMARLLDASTVVWDERYNWYENASMIDLDQPCVRTGARLDGNVPMVQTIRSACQLSTTEYVVTGDKGLVLLFTTGTYRYVAKSIGTVESIMTMVVVDGVVVVGGSNGFIAYSVDWFNTWTISNLGQYRVNKLAVLFGVLVAVCDQGTMYSSIDHAQSWQLVDTQATGDLVDLCVCNNLGLGVAVGKNSALMTTINGTEWRTVCTGLKFEAVSIVEFCGTVPQARSGVYINCEAGKMLYTSDSDHWCFTEIGTPYSPAKLISYQASHEEYPAGMPVVKNEQHLLGLLSGASDTYALDLKAGDRVILDTGGYNDNFTVDSVSGGVKLTGFDATLWSQHGGYFGVGTLYKVLPWADEFNSPDFKLFIDETCVSELTTVLDRAISCNYNGDTNITVATFAANVDLTGIYRLYAQASHSALEISDFLADNDAHTVSFSGRPTEYFNNWEQVLLVPNNYFALRHLEENTTEETCETTVWLKLLSEHKQYSDLTICSMLATVDPTLQPNASRYVSYVDQDGFTTGIIDWPIVHPTTLLFDGKPTAILQNNCPEIVFRRSYLTATVKPSELTVFYNQVPVTKYPLEAYLGLGTKLFTRQYDIHGTAVPFGYIVTIVDVLVTGQLGAEQGWKVTVTDLPAGLEDWILTEVAKNEFKYGDSHSQIAAGLLVRSTDVEYIAAVMLDIADIVDVGNNSYLCIRAESGLDSLLNRAGFIVLGDMYFTQFMVMSPTLVLLVAHDAITANYAGTLKFFELASETKAVQNAFRDSITYSKGTVEFALPAESQKWSSQLRLPDLINDSAIQLRIRNTVCNNMTRLFPLNTIRVSGIEF